MPGRRKAIKHWERHYRRDRSSGDSVSPWRRAAAALATIGSADPECLVPDLDAAPLPLSAVLPWGSAQELAREERRRAELARAERRRAANRSAQARPAGAGAAVKAESGAAPEHERSSDGGSVVGGRVGRERGRRACCSACCWSRRQPGWSRAPSRAP